ncbi:MAG: hypothetical protein HYU04_01735 [Candidatus Wildermuthbacteria bacterium]|nr:hypothetical protein [Candidatus Wildermuthbacteria bacterium]
MKNTNLLLFIGAGVVALIAGVTIATNTNSSAGVAGVNIAARSQSTSLATLEVQSAKGKTGEQVTISVTGKNIEKAAGLSFQLYFDNKIVAIPEKGVKNKPIGNFLVDSVFNNEQGRVGFAFAGINAIGSKGKKVPLIDITFNLIGSPATYSAIFLAKGSAVSAYSQSIPLTFIDGEITIEGQSIASPTMCQYDENKDGKLSRLEATQAVTDHLLTAKISRTEAIEIVTTYLTKKVFVCQ